MASVPLPRRLALRERHSNPAAGRNPAPPRPDGELLQTLALAGRRLLGAVLLLLGILMMSTLLLLPVGLPLALLAVTLLAAPGRCATNLDGWEPPWTR
jgi:hypothetical protein